MPQRAIKQCLQSEGTCSIQYRLHSSQAFQPLGCIHTRHSRSVLDRYSTRSSRLRGGGRLYLYRASALEQQSPKLALPQPIWRPVVKLETSISLSGRASNNATFPTRPLSISAAFVTAGLLLLLLLFLRRPHSSSSIPPHQRPGHAATPNKRLHPCYTGLDPLRR